MNESILEKLAELEHEQWIYWRKEIEKHYPKMHRSEFANLKYSQLPEHQKEADRLWARKVLTILKGNNI